MSDIAGQFAERFPEIQRRASEMKAAEQHYNKVVETAQASVLEAFISWRRTMEAAASVGVCIESGFNHPSRIPVLESLGARFEDMKLSYQLNFVLGL